MTAVYSPELREARLRVRIDELKERADRLAAENYRLRKQVERKNLKIAAQSREIRESALRAELALREQLRAARQK